VAETAITRHFVTVGRRQVHYRRSGSGPPVILLHMSPNWSKSLDPFTRAYAGAGFTAIALDTPGYGLSDLLPIAQPEIGDFADALKDTLDALGINHCGVFGSHTGATISMEFIRRYPKRASACVFDGYPGYTDAYRADMLKHYLPPIEPKWDGTHLVTTWHKFREQFMFSPLFRPGRANRTNSAPPAADFVQDNILPRLMTGENYNVGYSAVFRYRGLDPIKELTVPTCFAAREGDSLLAAFRFFKGLPKGCWTQKMPRDLEAAAAKYARVLKPFPARGRTPRPPAPAPLAGAVTRDYATTPFGQVMVRRAGPAGGVPLVLLPTTPGAGDLHEPEILALAKHRPVIAIDLPGCGDSDSFAEAFSVEAFGAALGTIVDALGIERMDLLAWNGAAPIAAEFIKRWPKRVRKLVLYAPMILPEPARLALGPNYARPIVPRWDGAHLLELWFALRNEQLFWPWYNETVDAIRAIEPKIDPRHLSRRLVGILKQYRNYAPIYQALFNYPIEGALSALKVPALVTSAEHDPFDPFARGAAKLIAGARFAGTDGTPAALAATIDRFLAS
jgi:pimeloyl-ACP methyl ester carboxylesterase